MQAIFKPQDLFLEEILTKLHFLKKRLCAVATSLN